MPGRARVVTPDPPRLCDRRGRRARALRQVRDAGALYTPWGLVLRGRRRAGEQAAVLVLAVCSTATSVGAFRGTSYPLIAVYDKRGGFSGTASTATCAFTPRA